ncbi:MAG: sulfotransferase [Magnetococcales bacterium]|nr:sulfotransferase [Magnetococcales bacterium]
MVERQRRRLSTGGLAPLAREAVAAFQAGALDRALALTDRILERHPREAAILELAATIHRRLGRFAEAEGLLRRAIAAEPDRAGFHLALGKLCRRQGRAEEAIAALTRALELAPGHAGAGVALGQLLLELNLPGRAGTLLEGVVAAGGDHPRLFFHLGEALLATGSVAPGVEALRRAFAGSPGDAELAADCAEALLGASALEVAGELLAKAREGDPRHPRLAFIQARWERRRGESGAAREGLEGLLRSSLADPLAARVHNELGLLLDALGETEAAFDHFRRGNDLGARLDREAGIDPESYPALLAAVREVVEAAPAAAGGLRDVGGGVGEVAVEDPPLPWRLAFLVGFPRSGTTLLDQILDAHPAISVIEERPLLAALEGRLPLLTGREYPGALGEITTSRRQHLRELYTRVAAEYLQGSPQLLVDKFPLNIRLLPLAAKLFPEARVVVALRHPADVVLSGFMQHFAPNVAMTHLHALATGARLYAGVMGLWEAEAPRLGLPWHRIRYEDLVAAPEAEARALLAFLGVDWDAAILDFDRHARARGTIRTPSAAQVTRKLHGEARYRWRRYHRHLAPVLPLLQPFIDRFGYGEEVWDK